MRELLRHHDARLVLFGQSVSALGDWLLMLVFGIWVKDLTGSNGLAGAVILAMAAPGLLAPLAGVVVDRLPRTWLLVGNDVVAALALTPLLLVRSAADVWLIYLVAALYGLGQQVLNAGVTALVQEMLEPDLLASANGTLAAVRQSMRLVGPLVGAGLYAAGGAWVIVGLDMATFLVSAAAFAAVRAGRHRVVRDVDTAGTPADPAASGLLAEVAGGWHFARRDPVLRPLLVATVLAFSCIGFLEPAIFAIVEAFDRPPSFVGVVATAQGAGAVVGGLLAGAVLRRIGASRGVQLALLGLALALTVTTAAWFALVMAVVPVAGALLPLLDVSLTTLLQLRTPAELMGRVAALLNLVFSVPSMVSIGVGAALIDTTGYAVLLLAAAAALLAGGLLALVTLPKPSAYVDATSASAYADGHVDPR